MAPLHWPLAEADVRDYIEAFYNPSRRHSHLDGVNPEQFEVCKYGSSATIDTSTWQVAWGGPTGRALADDLLAHTTRWAELGAPSLAAFGHRFVLASGAHPSGLAIRRLDHDQLVDLP